MTEQQVRDEIAGIMERFGYVLDTGMATVDVNAGLALMQLSTKAQLDTLYLVLGERRPMFACDDPRKVNR